MITWILLGYLITTKQHQTTTDVQRSASTKCQVIASIRNQPKQRSHNQRVRGHCSLADDHPRRASRPGRGNQRRVGRARFCSIPLPGISPRAKVCARQPGSSGLIFGLIHLRSPTFIGIQINVATQVTNVNGTRRTVIPTPENRKAVNRGAPDSHRRGERSTRSTAIVAEVQASAASAVVSEDGAQN